jgi:hypothetical protein
MMYENSRSDTDGIHGGEGRPGVPLFETANYEASIAHHGGRITFTAPENTWAFVPDGHWKGKARKKVGWIAKTDWSRTLPIRGGPPAPHRLEPKHPARRH